MPEAVIVDAVRSPIGKRNGSLAGTHPVGLLAPQGISADLIASKWGLTREEADDFAARSHEKAAAATKAGYFEREILPIKVAGENGSTQLLEHDEGIRFELNREKMGSLAPAFQNPMFEEMFPGQLNWTVTAANSSQISDGASAVLIASKETAEQLGLKPRARVVSFSLAGDSPTLMLTAPIPATKRALDRSGLELEDIEVVEINEAFASVVLAWQRELK